MTFNQKIEEWIQEAETRPASALTILKLIAGRLRDLTERNEQLMAENLALQDGTRIQDYQKRIIHLERQLEMLKRQVAEGSSLPGLAADATADPMLNLLVYNAAGQIFRFAPSRVSTPSGTITLGQIRDKLVSDGEFPRLLAIPAHEELLFLFTSGRVNTLRMDEIPLTEGDAFAWDAAPRPNEPHAGELLAAIMPLTRLPLTDFFIQVSRRGFVKKTLNSLAQSILDNHYLGRGTTQKFDQPFDASLCKKGERYVMVTYEGRLLGFDVDDLTYSAEERLRISPTDYVIAAFTIRAGQTILCVTQNGKVIQREAGFVEVSKSTASRGQALISPSRLEQGTRFIGAAAISETDKIATLDANGQISVYEASEAAATGLLHVQAALLSIGVVPIAKNG